MPPVINYRKFGYPSTVLHDYVSNIYIIHRYVSDKFFLERTLALLLLSRKTTNRICNCHFDYSRINQNNTQMQMQIPTAVYSYTVRGCFSGVRAWQQIAAIVK